MLTVFDVKVGNRESRDWSRKRKEIFFTSEDSVRFDNGVIYTIASANIGHKYFIYLAIHVSSWYILFQY